MIEVCHFIRLPLFRYRARFEANIHRAIRSFAKYLGTSKYFIGEIFDANSQSEREISVSTLDHLIEIVHPNTRTPAFDVGRIWQGIVDVDQARARSIGVCSKHRPLSIANLGAAKVLNQIDLPPLGFVQMRWRQE